MQILVVEDHADTRKVLTSLLTRWGHDVSAADSLKTGLERLNTEPPVEVLVSDIALPDGTGYALVSEARRAGKRVLAIAISGYAFPSDVRIAKLTGFDHHLSKPCDCHYLRTILQDRARVGTNARSGKTERFCFQLLFGRDLHVARWTNVAARAVTVAH